MAPSFESYKHIAAKAVLAGWLRRAAELAGGFDHCADFCGLSWRVNRPAPGFGIWEEYPVTAAMCDTGRVDAWDELGHPTPPEYRTLVDTSNAPLAIFDIAVQHKGTVLYAVEVVHESPPSAAKIDILSQLDCCTVVVDAEWVLRQLGPPSTLMVLSIYGARGFFSEPILNADWRAA